MNTRAVGNQGMPGEPWQGQGIGGVIIHTGAPQAAAMQVEAFEGPDDARDL